MNILLIDGSDKAGVVEYLEGRGHDVLLATTLGDATTLWRNRSITPIDLIVSELNLDPIGLAENLAVRSDGGLLSGWYWIISVPLNDEPAMRERIIVFSSFVEELKGRVERRQLQGIRMVAELDELGRSLDAACNAKTQSRSVATAIQRIRERWMLFAKSMLRAR